MQQQLIYLSIILLKLQMIVLNVQLHEDIKISGLNFLQYIKECLPH